MSYWTLCFQGWTRVGVSDGLLVILTAHLPQLRVAP